MGIIEKFTKNPLSIFFFDNCTGSCELSNSGAIQMLMCMISVMDCHDLHPIWSFTSVSVDRW